MKLKTMIAAALAALALAATAGADPAPARTSLAELASPLVAASPLAPRGLNCGIPPIPPIGCRVGDCVCDQNGNNCRWTFVCN